MNETIKQMAERLKSNPAMLQSLLQSQDGQSLMRMLDQSAGGGLQQAAQAAAKGNPEALARMIRQLMQTPQGAELISRINRTVQN